MRAPTHGLPAAALLFALASPPASAQQLIAHFRLDETGGNVAEESSGVGQDGTYVGGYQLDQPGARPATGASVLFDGTDGHVEIPGWPLLDGLTADFSVSAWLRVTDTNAGWRRVFANDLSWGAGIWQNQLTFTTNGLADYFSGGVIQQDAWLHAVWVFDASYTATFYVDGVVANTVGGPAPANPAAPTWYVASKEGATHMFPGYVDDVQVYVGALSADDARFLFEHPGAVLGDVGTAYCFGDGSGTFCPCGNAAGPDEGCANSTGAGALLRAVGTTSVALDDLLFPAEHLLPSQPALLFAGLNAVNGGSGIPFGDGLRCAGGSVVRLGVMVPDAGGSAEWGPGLAAQGGWGAGDLRRFQVWYRDPGGSPCGFGFNLSHGLEVLFGP